MELNDICLERRPHKPSIADLLNQIPTKTPRVQNKSLRKSNIDLEDACRQLKLSERTSRQCNLAITGGNIDGFY